MEFILKILNRIFKSEPKWIHDWNSKYVIKEAFTIGGRTYYMFDDVFNVPYERGLKSLVYYEEFRMRINKEYLGLHIDAMDKILSDPKKIDIGKIAILNKQLKERLELIVEPDMLYKLASVVFFDKNEKPWSYEFDYAEKKIKFWKKNATNHAFFLETPLVKLIPFLKLSETNLDTYSTIVEKVNQIHYGYLSDLLSNSKKMNDSGKDSYLRPVTRQN